MTDDKEEKHHEEEGFELTGGPKGFHVKATGSSAAGLRFAVSIAIVILSIAVLIGIIAATILLAKGGFNVSLFHHWRDSLVVDVLSGGVRGYCCLHLGYRAA